jgi:hypothetical protein
MIVCRLGKYRSTRGVFWPTGSNQFSCAMSWNVGASSTYDAVSGLQQPDEEIGREIESRLPADQIVRDKVIERPLVSARRSRAALRRFHEASEI